MTHTFPQTKRIQVLLNTLLGERHARRALLAELIDELATAPSQHVAARAARALLRSLDEPPVEDDLYRKRILRIGDLAKASVTETTFVAA